MGCLEKVAVCCLTILIVQLAVVSCSKASKKTLLKNFLHSSKRPDNITPNIKKIRKVSTLGRKAVPVPVTTPTLPLASTRYPFKQFDVNRNKCPVSKQIVVPPIIKKIKPIQNKKDKDICQVRSYSTNIPEIVANPNLICYKETGSFPDIEYPQTASDIWKPYYWKRLPGLDKCPDREPYYWEQKNNGLNCLNPNANYSNPGIGNRKKNYPFKPTIIEFKRPTNDIMIIKNETDIISENQTAGFGESTSSNINNEIQSPNNSENVCESNIDKISLLTEKLESITGVLNSAFNSLKNSNGADDTLTNFPANNPSEISDLPISNTLPTNSPPTNSVTDAASLSLLLGALLAGSLPVNGILYSPITGLPLNSLPTQILPTEGLSTDGLSIGGLPTDALPVGGLATDALPVGGLPSDALPVGGLPTDALPVGGLPTDALPVGDLPTDALPVGGLPMDALPVGGLPTDALPVGGLPTYSLPVGGLPTDALPVGGLATDTLPVRGLPTDVLPVGGLPTDELPVGGLPTDALPVGGLPTDSLPVGSLPTDALPVGGLLTDAQPVGGLPTDALPVGGLPTDSLPVGSLPTDALSVGNLPTSNTLPVNDISPPSNDISYIEYLDSTSPPTELNQDAYQEFLEDPFSDPDVKMIYPDLGFDTTALSGVDDINEFIPVR